MSHKRSSSRANLLPGRARTHGGYSFLATGKLPEHRREVRAYLSGARAGLIRDLGPTETDLTAAQIILIDRTVTALGLVRCIEEHVRLNGVMKGSDLAPSLQQSYLAYVNHIRLNLVALGIKDRAGEGKVTLADYIKAKDVEKSQTKAKPGKARAKDATKPQTKARKANPGAENRQAEAGTIPNQMTGDNKIVDPGAPGDDIPGPGEGGIDCDGESDQDHGSGHRQIGQREAPHEAQDRPGIEIGHASASRMDERGPDGQGVAGDE